MDTQRLGASVARPGMDTRTWVSLAFAMNDSVVNDGSQPGTGFGMFVDVQLVPTGEQFTARIGAEYAGNGFGLYKPVHANDNLVVVIPSGDPAHGCVVVSRFNNSSDPPPQLATANPLDFVLVIEPNQNLSIQVSGSGNVDIEADSGNITVNSNSGNVNVTTSSGMVNLGSAMPPDFVALASMVLSQLTAIVDNLTTNYTAIATAITGVGGSYVPTPPTAPSSVASKVVATE